jgi:hypothetical protein
VEYNKRVGRETQKLREVQEKDSNKAVLAKLDKLVKLNENLKSQEAYVCKGTEAFSHVSIFLLLNFGIED